MRRLFLGILLGFLLGYLFGSGSGFGFGWYRAAVHWRPQLETEQERSNKLMGENMILKWATSNQEKRMEWTNKELHMLHYRVFELEEEKKKHFMFMDGARLFKDKLDRLEELEKKELDNAGKGQKP